MIQQVILKELSANDAGETGGHQAGILIPKDPRLLGFFPNLSPEILNPRCHLPFKDASGREWEFAFIYYNNKLFGGTRNEYRLTRMTKYIRVNGLTSGDEIELTYNSDDSYEISHRKKHKVAQNQLGILKLGSGWKTVKLA